jgi:hypothetical protein
MEHHTTIDEVARMINEGFKSTATKEDLKAVNTRLDRIEHLLLANRRSNASPTWRRA